MRKLGFFVAMIACLWVVPDGAAAASALVKGSTPAVYYVDEGKRYVFPNEKVYFSWYRDFAEVRTVSDDELASYVIGGNVTYRPGSRLVKIQSDPRVFAISAGGRLRWVSSERAASALYGSAWKTYVDDLPDAFFFTYKEGEPVASYSDFDRLFEQSIASIADDLASRNGAAPAQDLTAKRSGAWSDSAVWGGGKPGTGARVTIPAGLNVTYDLENGPTLKTLDIHGTLAFATDRSTRLAARRITVRGAMTAGTPEAPLPDHRRLELTLTGAASTAITDDGLKVDGGTLALYGAEVGPAWVRLEKPVPAGATKLTLDAPVAWNAGSQIAVLGATNAQHEFHRIKAVDGTVVTLDQPLEHAHRSEDGLRSEVALLARNISIQGMGGRVGASLHAFNRASVALRNVELIGLGRYGIAGQYPLFLDGVLGASVQSSVIRDADNRCIVLRQASGARIERNVALNASGHCLATEDGAETSNAFTENLVAQVQPGGLPNDGTPAAFLLRHPGNRVEGNVAVGSAGFGYWYWLPDEATSNAGVKVRPREAMLDAFAGNVARANGKVGLYVDDGKGTGDYIPPLKASFQGLVSVLNGERGFWARGVNLEVTDALLAENPIGGTFAAFGAILKNSRVSGRLPTSAKPGPARHGFTFYEGPVRVQDVAFSQFTGTASALGFEMQHGKLPDPRNSLSGLVLTDANAWRAPDPAAAGDFMTVVRDLDQGGAIGMNSPFLGKACALERGNVRRCTGAYAQVEAALRGGNGTTPLTVTELENGATITFTPGEAFDGLYGGFTAMEGGSYRIEAGATPAMDFDYYGVTEPVLLRVPASAGASVRKHGTVMEKVPSEALVPGRWAFDAAASEAVLWLNPGESLTLTR